MKTILFIAAGTLLFILAATVTANHLLYKIYQFLDQHR